VIRGARLIRRDAVAHFFQQRGFEPAWRVPAASDQIFLHDTPSRELFRADTRTFSSGCIRVERPLELAAALLQQQDWTPEKIEQAVASGRSETIPLERAVPVLIVYWTVSVGASGDLRFARDVYTRDPPLIRALNAR